jgi:zinc ribbon protein
MPELCSCGAQLPPDARFCHKCGKPLFEEARVPEVEELPRETPPPAPAPLNFHNPIAVRVGFTVASLAALLTWLPFVSLGFVVWWTGAGFLAVYLYRRRTGQLLTVSSGLRIGWMTGILTFMIMVVLLTVTLLPLALSGSLAAAFQQQLRSMPSNDPAVREAMRVFQSGAGIAAMVVFALGVIFAFVTLFASAGGALGAKIVGRED